MCSAPHNKNMVSNKKQIRALQAAAESITNAAKGQAVDPNAVLKLDQILMDVAGIKNTLNALAAVVNATAKTVDEFATNAKAKK